MSQTHNGSNAVNAGGNSKPDYEFVAQKQKSSSEQQESNSTSSNEEDLDPKRLGSFLSFPLRLVPSND